MDNLTHKINKEKLKFEDELLTKIARQALSDSHIKLGEEVLVVADMKGSRRFFDQFIKIANTRDISPHLLLWQYDHSKRSMYDYYSYSPPKIVIDAMLTADVIYAMTENNFLSWFSYHLYPQILKTGRIIWLRALEEHLFRVAGHNVNLEKIRKKGKILYKKFSKTKKMKIKSKNGTNVTVDRVRNSTAYYYSGEVFEAGEESDWPGGMAYVGFDKETVNGTIVLDGGMKHFGLLKEPIKLIVESDRIVSVEGGVQAKMFRRFIKDLDDPNFPYIVHLGLGTNPGAKTMNDGSESEDIKGAIIWAIGRQEYFFEKGESLYPFSEGLTARNHFNPTTLDGTLWLDNELILENGEFVTPDLN